MSLQFIHVMSTHEAKAVIFASTSGYHVDIGHCIACQLVDYSISILVMSTRYHHYHCQHLQAPTPANDARRRCHGRRRHFTRMDHCVTPTAR